MNVARSASEAWNEEYRRGRYADDPPVAFADDILLAAAEEGLTSGLYVGCGNGRNLLPLVDGGLDVVGLDISEEAIRQLAQRRPDRAGRLRHGDLESLPAGMAWPFVIGLQVFQHGNGGFTVRYTAGPKTGLSIHFFSAEELHQLFEGWPELLPIRADSIQRTPPAPGQWTQWEAIWRRPTEPSSRP